MKNAKNLYNLLIKNQYTITFAESCTGGLMASSLVDIPGASSVFGFGFVTYSAEAKKSILDVKSQTIEEFGIVSENVANEMIQGAIKKSHANVGISITGCAGPGKDTDGNLPGTVCFGFSVNGKITTKKILIDSKDRNTFRLKAVEYAFEVLSDLLA